MSGLEPLAALSLACNIFQTIAFGVDIIKLIKSLRRTGSFDPTLSRKAEVLGDISSQLRSSPPTANSTPDEQRLFNIARDCANIAKKLQNEIASLAADATKSGFTATLKVVPKTMWKKRRLNSLESKLGQAETMMQNGLLARTCNRFDAVHTSLDQLDDRLRHFWDQYNKGYDTALKLVTSEASVTRQHIEAESSRTRGEVKSHFTSELERSEKNVRQDVQTVADSSTRNITGVLNDMKLKEFDDKTRERLLQSLKFSGMNERRNQVVPADISTFRWIFPESASSNASDSTLYSDEESLESYSNDSEISGSDYDRETVEAISDDEDDDIPHARWDSFTRWLQSDANVYWISGKPGSGKTTLVNYILSKPETIEHLSHSGSNYIILSHFFWRPGSPMQQNIKGMLCSLLYQLFHNNETVIDWALTNYGVQHADSDSDWSVNQLHVVLVDTIRYSDKEICLFLDGLDEVDPRDGTIELLKMVQRIVDAGKVKVCLSSRPETLIQNHLEQHPHLRLQDLTHDDLYKYANHHVEFPEGSNNTAELTKAHVLHMLVRKAEGVFLWLCLAIRSINRGLQFNDNLEHIRQRVNDLPGDLRMLYQDMWERMNEDKRIYQQSAALYFKLVLANERMYRSRTPYYAREVSLLSLTLITSGLAEEILEKKKVPVSAEEILTLCQRTIRDVEIRCAGFLEFTLPEEIEISKGIYQKLRQINGTYVMNPFKSSNPRLPDIDNPFSASFLRCLAPCWNERLGALRPFVDLYWPCRFIHRTAYDYFFDTSEGKDILSHDSIPDEQVHVKLIEARLATCWSGDFGNWFTRRSGVSMNLLEHVLGQTLIIETYPFLNKAYLKQEQKRLTVICESFFTLECLDPIKIRHPSELYSVELFLLLTASLGLYEYVLDRIQTKSMSPEFKSDLLLHVTNRLNENPLDGPDQAFAKLILWLLENGADPNRRGPVLPIQYGFLMKNQTPFECLMEAILCVFWHRQGGINIFSSILKITNAFLRHGADITGSIYCVYLITDGKGQFMSATDIYLKATWVSPDAFAVYSIPAFSVMQIFLQQARDEELPGIGSSNKAELDLLQSQCKRSRDHTSERFLGIGAHDSAAPPGYIHNISTEDSDSLTEAFSSMLGQPGSAESWNTIKSLCYEVLSYSEASDISLRDYLERISLLLRPSGGDS